MNGCLLVDMGNSRLKWAWLTDGELSMEAAAYGGADLSSLLDRLWGDRECPRAVWISSVGGQGGRLIDWVTRHWGCEIQLAASEAVFGDLSNGYLQPERLGVDRWLALVGARAALPRRSVCVLDLGTAVTLDIVDASGEHLGGYIMPGLSLMRDSLQSRTGLASGMKADKAPARDTDAAIASGTLNAIAGLLRHATELYRQNHGEPPQIILTGGDAVELARLLDLPYQHRPALVLEGLAELAKQGTRNPCVGSSAS